MSKFTVHIRRHCGWHTTEAEGATFGDAAVAAVVVTEKSYGLDLDNIPHTVEFNEKEDYQSVVFREASSRQVFGGVTHPGELWFGERVREGQEGDCEPCGGTGYGFHNPFRQCWACGDRTQPGVGSGKKRETAEA